MNPQTNWRQFGTLITVFFFWGFIAASNSIFIPFCKTYFNLNQFESQLIGFAFYGAYFIGSLILFLLSEFRSVDILNKIGYKKGIIVGLIISIMGALLMIPAVSNEKRVPIAATMEQIANFKDGQRFNTADKELSIVKEGSGDEYKLIVKNNEDAPALLNNTALTSLLNTNGFQYNKTNTGATDESKYVATFSKANLSPVLSNLEGKEVAFGSFYFILAALFIVALGFSLQQTSAQPFAVSMGSPETGSHRLNMAGGVNSFGTLWGPIIVSLFLFGQAGGSAEDASISSIKTLYFIVAGVFTLVAAIFAISKLPKITNNEKFEKSTKASRLLVLITAFIIAIFGYIFAGSPTEDTQFLLLFLCTALILGSLFYANSAAIKSPEGWGAMKYPQLVWGMVAIFVYVGVEVTIDNNLGALLKTPGYLKENGLDESEISHFISLYWGSLMVGRWTGAISVFNISKTLKKILTFVVPFIAFGFILLANLSSGSEVTDLLPYIPCIIVLIIAFLYSNERPIRTLLVVSTLAVVAMLIGVFTTGYVSLFALLSGGLFCSVMWPSIFALSIGGLGKYSSQGSAFLIMMILGGAIIPLLHGTIGDKIGMHKSYLIAAACFAFLILFTVKVKAYLKKQGYNFDETVSGGH